MNDINQVGGKNASLGEMITNLSKSGVKVPNGFAITTDAYTLFIKEAGLENTISDQLAELNEDNLNELAITSKSIRSLIFKSAVTLCYHRRNY